MKSVIFPIAGSFSTSILVILIGILFFYHKHYYTNSANPWYYIQDNQDIYNDTNQHSMGYRVRNIDIENIDDGTIQKLKYLTAKHGVIVLENGNKDLWSSQDLLVFASKFGELIKLPNGFGFNTSHLGQTESFITNITNIDPITGNILNVNTAEYLHNDGDFWQNNYIYTFLYGDVIPTKGGNTHFVDLQVAHNYIKQHHRDIYNMIYNESVVIDVNDIPDFKGSPFLDDFNSKYDIAKHNMINQHIVTHKSILYYACRFAAIDGFSLEKSHQLLDEIDNILINTQILSYFHEWNQKDLIIWDNTRVMHRSMGGYYTQPRKLWRIQSRLSINT